MIWRIEISRSVAQVRGVVVRHEDIFDIDHHHGWD
jgi:hypothetical protein